MTPKISGASPQRLVGEIEAALRQISILVVGDRLIDLDPPAARQLRIDRLP
jgi:hypothetical protein